MANDTPSTHEDASIDASPESALIPTSVKIARAWFVLIGVIWIIFGIVTLDRMADLGSSSTSSILFIAFFMFANALFMFLLAWGISQQKRSFFLFAILVLLVNILLTVTDEFGSFDLIILLLNIGLLSMLVVTRGRYWSSKAHL